MLLILNNTETSAFVSIVSKEHSYVVIGLNIHSKIYKLIMFYFSEGEAIGANVYIILSSYHIFLQMTFLKNFNVFTNDNIHKGNRCNSENTGIDHSSVQNTVSYSHLTEISENEKNKICSYCLF